MSDDRKPRTPADEEPPKATEKEERQKKEPGKLDYVFKIVPADPKNSFDFEDVADK